MKRVKANKKNEAQKNMNEFKMAKENIQSHLKKLKYLFAAMALVATMSLASCSNDDDPQPEQPVQPIPPENIGNQLPENPEAIPY